MNSSVRWGLAAVLSVLATSALAKEPLQEYVVHGVIRDVRLERKELVVKHEAIPDFMEGMTMPFHVHDAVILAGLHKGDTVAFHLMISSAESWVEKIQLISASAPDSIASRSSSVEPLAAVALGAELPDVPLVGQDGKAFHLADFHGTPVALTFIYTRCPLPDMCPLLSAKFAGVQKQMAASGWSGAHLLSVSFDPERDTPEVLRKYGQIHHADGKRWRMATGNLADITRLALACGADFWPEQGIIAHHLRILVLDANGRVQHIHQGGQVRPETLYQELRDLADPQKTQ